MFNRPIPRPVHATERRRLPRSPEATAIEPRPRGEREFGVGYGRSSGYVRTRSYVTSQPALFRCR